MYTAGFEDAMKILTETMAKEKKLDTAVKEFEVSTIIMSDTSMIKLQIITITNLYKMQLHVMGYRNYYVDIIRHFY